MKKSISFLAALLPFLSGAAADNSLPLDGQWRFALDRRNVGIQEGWYAQTLPDKFHLPGSLPAQGIGDAITTNTPWVGGVKQSPWFNAPEYEKYRQPGKVKVPFWLQPEKYYKGVAWYQRDIKIPANWKDKRVVLSLERPHWETRVWVDGKLIGTNDSLSTPHEYELGQLAPVRHSITIRVDNRMIVDIGENSHAISDHTQGDWNGVVGKVQLRATPRVWLDDVQVYPNVVKKSALVKVHIGNDTGAAGDGFLTVGKQTVPVHWNAKEGDASVEIALGDKAQLWDEFQPTLQHLPVTLQSSELDSREVTFGLREISTQGTQFVLNGRKIFIRGTLECCIFPKTGHPPTEVDEWKRVIRVAKSYGLNLLRFHSYCPPEAAFVAADQLGMYLQVETCWANQSTTLGDGKPVDQWVDAETARILKAYGNHPSFVLMPYGNEPGGKNANPFLAKYVAHYKAIDPRRLWTSGSGWPQIPENQFHISPDPRVQLWGAGLKSRINGLPPETETDYHAYISKRSVPVISHEIGQWCVYPNFAEMPKYTGYLKPKNFEIFRQQLANNGLSALAKPFLLASGKLQTLCYKEDIESALRTSGMGGFELLDLHDFPGQGTALVGVLDPFWEDKGYVTAAEYSRFCNSTVPLARLGKRLFTTEEPFEAKIEIAHFGPRPLKNAVTSWKIVADSGMVWGSGELPPADVPIGNGFFIGTVTADLNRVKAPSHCKFVATVSFAAEGVPPAGSARARFENDWDIWIYPPVANARPSHLATNVVIASRFDHTAEARLRAGDKVLLTIPGKEVRNFDVSPVKLGFSSIFWNTAWTDRQAPTTLGILCDPKHPALAQFPTEYHSNWQWWYLIHRAGALRLDLLPARLEPIVRAIDDWVTARPLGLIIEGKVGPGKIVICSFDLTQVYDGQGNGANDPVSRQMRASLLDYMTSHKFDPGVELTPDQIRSLFAQPKERDIPLIRSVQADSAQEGYEPENAIDADPETMWHTSWEANPPGFPHELILQFAEPTTIAGFTALPRQDGNHNGWIKDYAFYASTDGKTWSQPVIKGVFPEDAALKTLNFTAPLTARAVKLVALSGYADAPWASLAEFHVIVADQK